MSVLNPFSSFQDSWDGVVFDDIPEGGVSDIQAILDQVVDDDEDWSKSIWLNNVVACFENNIIGIVQESFDISFRQERQPPIQPEISCPDWGAFKLNMVEAATCYNLDLFTTGLLREIYHEYIKHIYESGYDKIYYADDLPKFSYDTLHNFLAVWEILQGLSLRKEEETE